MSGKSGEKTVPISDTVGGGEGEATGGNSGGGGTTMATQRKRLRRVSFAEMTSVHFFDRDEEDNETPKEQQQSAAKGGNGDMEKEEILGFLQLVDSQDKEEEEGVTVESEEDEDQGGIRRPFLRPIESPSSGSGFGSATSNDDDFFGPVSASFIRRGLSDSEASYDNRDVTMDSTAFSMHFRSLAQSDSGVDLKTPTGIHIFSEDKPASQTNKGNTMELTVSKKLLTITSSPSGKRTANSSSSDMSLVGESPSKYDYGRLSPELDALLTEGTNTLDLISDSHDNAAFDSPRNWGNGSFPLREKLSVASESPNKFGYTFSAPEENLSELVDLTGNKEKAVYSLQGQSDEVTGLADIQYESPTDVFVSSPFEQRKIPEISSLPVKYVSVLTPQQVDSSLRKEEMDNHWSTPSIQKSISKLNLLEASPFSSSTTSKLEKLKLKQIFSKSSPFKIQLEREMNSFQPKYFDASSRGVESQLLVGSPMKGPQISEPSSGISVLDKIGRENISPTEESNAAGFLSSLSSGKKGSSGTLGQLVTSPESQKKLTVYSECQNSCDIVLPDQFANLQKSGLKENGVNVNRNIDPLDRLESFAVGTRLHPVSSVNPKDSIDVNAFDKQDFSQMIDNRGTPVRVTVSPLKYSTGMEGRLHDFIGPHESTSNLLWGKPQSVPSGGFVTEGNIKELMVPQNAVEPLPLSVSKNPVISRKLIDPPYMEDFSSPTSHRLKSPRKRSEKHDFDDIEHHSVVSEQQRSSKLRKVVGHDDSQMAGGPNGDCRETAMIALGLKNWADIYSKFSEDGKRVASSSVDMLKLSVIDSFEDVLCNLKKAKAYGMLCNEIFLQKTSVCNDLRSERIGNIRLLLHLITHEKLKLQLISSKKKWLLEKLQQISSRVQDMQMLKMNLLPKFVGGTQAGACSLQNFISIKHSDEIVVLRKPLTIEGTANILCSVASQLDANEKVAAMKRALEAVNKKKANIIKVLRSYCKVKEEQSHSECILLANDHLMKEKCQRFIRLGMQIWNVENVRHGDDFHEILLNYLGFIIQSFKFAGCPASSIVIKNNLDDINIIKSFPNMNACEAFSSVLKAKTTQKYGGAESLAREVQVTSSFLGNLMDVVQEIQLARLELRNLTWANFHCPIVGQLNLHLDFFSFKHGKKVSLIFDASCLNRGIYPSDMLPSQVTVSFGGNTVLAEPITHEIQHAVNSVRAGYLRILRLCRCISQVVQASK